MSTIFNYQFAGRQGQFDVGWQHANWYDFKNIHVPIDHLEGKPVHWLYWEATGASYYADNSPWNQFKSPEQIFRWKDHLPAHEHSTLLNSIGQGYNWFHGNSPFHSRLARPTVLSKGQVELTFTFFADWYKWEDGKRPLNEVGDPHHARVEMHLVDTGLNEAPDWAAMDEPEIRAAHQRLGHILAQLPGRHEQWHTVSPTVGPTTVSRQVAVPRDGLYLVVFGAMAVWAIPGGSGRNGLWGHGMQARAVVTTPPTPPVVPTPPTPPTPPAPPPSSGTTIKQIYKPYPAQETTIILAPPLRSLTAAQKATLFELAEKGIPLPGGGRTAGEHPITTSHDFFFYNVTNGKEGTVGYVLWGEQIGTGLNREWVAQNVPQALPRVRFVQG
ncbi:MAG: hypothetical protein KJ063_03270 [Anaerolineae bacterium]|nr:hypothetical protein [Anaerolineae bacterium]